MIMNSPATSWGITPAEKKLPFPCDRYLTQANGAYFRAVNIRAPAGYVFRWLCQLKVAPYSYDWIDNRGHRSPRYLIDGLEQLEPGQSFMTIFQLAAFSRERHLTLVLSHPRSRRIFGDIALSYTLKPQGEMRCRLIVKLLVRYPARGPWRLMRWLLPWGDLLMMRKQLLTIKCLAEEEAGRPSV